MPRAVPSTAAADDPIVLVGALHVDELYWPVGPLMLHASNPVHRARRAGGVAANVARAALGPRGAPSPPDRDAVPPGRHGAAGGAARPVVLVAALGDDADGAWLVETLAGTGVDCRAVPVAGRASGRYAVVHDAAGELLVGLSDVDIAERLDAAEVRARLAGTRPAALTLDANLHPDCLASLLGRDAAPSHWRDVPRVALAVSPSKARRFAPHLPAIDLLLCNRREAAALVEADVATPSAALADALATAGCTRFVLCDGAAPVIVHGPDGRDIVPVPPVRIAGSVNGAGDALAGACLSPWLAHGDLAAAVRDAGLPAARAVLHAAPERHAPVAAARPDTTGTDPR